MRSTIEYQSWDSYLAKMATNQEWADHRVTLAVANVTGRDIWIWSSVNENPIVVEVNTAQRRNGAELEPMLLGHVSEIHYESLDIQTH